MKNYLIDKMEEYLEDACAYLAIGNKELFIYNAGKADALRVVLAEEYSEDERYATEHIKNMWEIIDENW